MQQINKRLELRGGNAIQIKVKIHVTVIEEVIILSQNLKGKIVHDDAATHHGHYDKNVFNNLKKRSGYSLTAANGTEEEPPSLGSIIQDGEQLDDVIYLPNIPYQIHSQYQLIEAEKL